jgi:D-serine deaminase-like pyridoxal phosphate-dependent protein
MTSLNTCPTPALVLDRSRLLANITRMDERAVELGVSLRPHLKTAKNIDIARLLDGERSSGITVSTLKEAEYFAEHGIRDILYAVSVVPAALPRISRLLQAGVRLQVILDQLTTATQLAQATTSFTSPLEVLIEIDTDGHRAGVEPADPELVRIAQALDQAPGLSLRGVLTHAGGSYGCRTRAQLEDHAEQERSRCVAAAQRLRDAGLPCPVVSVGSTPTALSARHLQGVTELRAGVYVFFDLFQAGLNVCSLEDLSLSVLTSVISHKHSSRRLIIDAGGLALSKDHSTAELPDDCGYGLVAEAGTGQIVPGLKVTAAFQEHGVIQLQEAADFSRFPVGSRLRILPNHACMTAAAHENYLLVDGGETVIDVWQRVNGW